MYKVEYKRDIGALTVINYTCIKNRRINRRPKLKICETGISSVVTRQRGFAPQKRKKTDYTFLGDKSLDFVDH